MARRPVLDPVSGPSNADGPRDDSPAALFTSGAWADQGADAAAGETKIMAGKLLLCNPRGVPEPASARAGGPARA